MASLIRQSRQLVFTVFFCIVWSFIPLNSSAQEDDTWTADQDYEVFSEPSVSSKKMGILKAGKEVELISKGRRWIRIRVRAKGKMLIAFIRNDKPVEEPGLVDTKHGWSMGGYMAYSYMLQSGRIFRDTDGNETEISNLSGGNFYPAFFVDWLFSEKWTFRGAVTGRKIILNGTAKYRVTVASNASSVELKQDFFGIMLQPQYKLFSFLNFWIAPSVEMAFGTKSIVFNVESEKPTYFLAFGSIGTRHAFRSFQITPEARAGVVINSKPAMLNLEMILAGAYLF